MVFEIAMKQRKRSRGPAPTRPLPSRLAMPSRAALPVHRRRLPADQRSDEDALRLFSHSVVLNEARALRPREVVHLHRVHKLVPLPPAKRDAHLEAGEALKAPRDKS